MAQNVQLRTDSKQLLKTASHVLKWMKAMWRSCFGNTEEKGCSAKGLTCDSKRSVPKRERTTDKNIKQRYQKLFIDGKSSMLFLGATP